METFADAVRQFRSAEAGGFTLGDEQTASLLNEGARRFAARSEHLKAFVSLGVTVVGQAVYELPDNVCRAQDLYVDGVPYSLTDPRTLQEVVIGNRQVFGVGGVFAEEASEDGKTKELKIWPVPEAAGIPLQIWGAVMPAPMEDTDVLPFGVEYNRGIVDFAKGIAYEDVDENAQSGTYFIERANGRAEELKEADKKRLGRNPRKARLASLRTRR